MWMRPPPPLPTHAQLFEAASEVPDLLIDAATLTGAARVALGPEVTAVFTNSDTAWEQLSAAASKTVRDGAWQAVVLRVYFARVTVW